MIAVTVTIKKHKDEIIDAGQIILNAPDSAPKKLENVIEKKVIKLDKKIYDLGLGIKHLLRRGERKIVNNVLKAEHTVTDPIIAETHNIKNEIRQDIEKVTHALHSFDLTIKKLPKKLSKEIEEDIEKIREKEIGRAHV